MAFTHLRTTVPDFSRVLAFISYLYILLESKTISTRCAFTRLKRTRGKKNEAAKSLKDLQQLVPNIWTTAAPSKTMTFIVGSASPGISIILMQYTFLV